VIRLSLGAGRPPVIPVAPLLIAVAILAGCATDDLSGWTERKDGEATRVAGILDGFELTREECEAMIMRARVTAGWITEADLAPSPAAGEDDDAAAAPEA